VPVTLLLKGITLSRYIELSLLLLLVTACQKETSKAGNDIALDKDRATTNESGVVSPKANGISEDQMAMIVMNVMDEQYGKKFNEKYQCWDFVATDIEDKQYCMKPSTAKLVSSKTGKSIYFYAANRADISDDLAYSYSSVDPGLFGAFKLLIDESGAWSYAAASKAMDFGSMGQCGCDQAEFLKLGAGDYYGWMFSSGGIWQGIAVLNYEIVAPLNGVFANISKIPEIREEDQDTTYQIKLDDSDATKKAFPLLVSKQKNGKAQEKLLVPFDETIKVYSLPDNF